MSRITSWMIEAQTCLHCWSVTAPQHTTMLSKPDIVWKWTKNSLVVLPKQGETPQITVKVVRNIKEVDSTKYITTIQRPNHRSTKTLPRFYIWHMWYGFLGKCSNHKKYRRKESGESHMENGKGGWPPYILAGQTN